MEQDGKSWKENKQDKPVKAAPIEKVEVVKEKVGDKITYSERLELEKLEGILEDLEAKKEALAISLGEFGDDHEKLMKLGVEMETLMKEIDTKTNRWIELSEKDA